MMNRDPRKSMIRHAIATGAALAALAIPHSAGAQSDNSTTIARVDLKALNGGGASGQATFRLSADQRTLTVSIKARGLDAGGIHLSHIHGLSENGSAVESTCPTSAQDDDGDGFVELAEGATTYGPILVDFMNVDPDQDGSISFERTVNLTGTEIALPLAMRHIVVHGKNVPPGPGSGTPGEVNGTNGYLVLLPVLCGEIRVTGKEGGPLQFRRPRS